MTVYHMDALLGMRLCLLDNSVDAIVTDPPYELGFMGKGWDSSGIAYSVDLWREALRVLKPGGHLLAFSGSRTYHRMACAIEDAGFEVRDQIMWVYGSGFPKSLDVSKAIDKRGGNSHLTAEIGAALKRARTSRGITIGTADAKYCGGVTLWSWYEGRPAGQQMPTYDVLARIAADWPEIRTYAAAVAEADRETVATVAGTRLAVAPGQTNDRRATERDITAPATDAARQWEGWGTALKPAHEPICVARKPLIGTVAANVLAHGTGALNIDGCRIESERPTIRSGGGSSLYEGGLSRDGGDARPVDGRWPANLIHDGSDEVRAAFPATSLSRRSTDKNALPYEPNNKNAVFGAGMGTATHAGFDDTDPSAARFFYCAKASKEDRGPGNDHPTVKPSALMQYLVRLVTPPGGLVLDPFTGSGSTWVGAKRGGFQFVGFELDAHYVDIASRRAGE